MLAVAKCQEQDFASNWQDAAPLPQNQFDDQKINVVTKGLEYDRIIAKNCANHTCLPIKGKNI